MDLLIAVAQQTSTSNSPVWLAPLLGGAGALVGGSLTSTVAWRVLSDTKKARWRAEEKEATEIITIALLEVRQIYRNTDVGSGPAPEPFRLWTDYLESKFGGSEAALMRLHNDALRKRVTSSLDLLVWGAHDSRLLYETRSTARAVANHAHDDAMACLGAYTRNEPWPDATKAWKDADGQLQWQFEQERRAAEGE
ncbi:hypothetical protein ACFRIB_40610 [Streptomyces mirabilis]|uniref:hypothetical protein n=1 Tax=Streptomyces mirabilis TaxID=68239 RepID=UPI003682ADD4